MADSLAKQHTFSLPLNFQYTNIYNPFHILQWEQNPVELPTRYFIKNICKAHILAMWSSQKRNNEWSHINHYIDWQSTWLYLNHNQKPSSNFTSFKLNQSKAFKIKALLNELPTYFSFHNIYPTIFTNTNCFRCNLPDSHSHWLTCLNPSLITNIINSSIQHILSKADLDLSTSQLHELIRKVQKHPSFDRIPFQANSFYLDLTLKGLIPKALIETIHNYNIPTKIASQIIIQTLLDINDQIYNQIWKPYCIDLSNWKKNNNITSLQTRNTHNTLQQIQQTRHYKRLHTNYTYSCLCGIADQLHLRSNTCPPIGQAIRKINIWSTLWINHSTSYNHILTLQI
jgi:hypothetical protein